MDSKTIKKLILAARGCESYAYDQENYYKVKEWVSIFQKNCFRILSGERITFLDLKRCFEQAPFVVRCEPELQYFFYGKIINDINQQC